MSDNYSYVAEDEMLFSASPKSEPETCLGMHFDSAEDRREYFRNELRKKLKDPEFRAIEGFPIGDDEDIIALSDPPYYCACPNPWIPDFIREWESQKTPSTTPYKREPFASDVSEGKNNPVYNAHSYHTKVPPKAVMRYILHYTNPGDIIYDGFCGTGMTGVATALCNKADAVEEIAQGNPKYKSGQRHVIQNDLSPVASFITYNYNSPCSHETIPSLLRIYDEVYKKLNWVYKTRDQKGIEREINYTVWSEVFICPNCGCEIVYYNEAFNKDKKIIEDIFHCPNCHSSLSKKSIEKAVITRYDPISKETLTESKLVPVLISYNAGGKKCEKTPDEDDIRLINQIENLDISLWYPNDLMMGKGANWGDSWRAGIHLGIKRVSQFYFKRSLLVLSTLFDVCKANRLLFVFNSIVSGLCSKMTRYNMGNRGNGGLAGTLYIPSLIAESNVFKVFLSKADGISRAFSFLSRSDYGLSSCQSSTSIGIPDNAIDYIFLDPPFGANINYSELSFLWEAWLRVKTNNKEEAIENQSQKKGLFEYRDLMRRCFYDSYRILKPGHWMTVEFSNTDSSVWNAIQTSLSDVGFIIANVSALDKQQGSFKAVTTSTAVKQDLILSLYKPDESFEQQITTAVGTEAVWTFVRKHLEYLPLVKKQGEISITVPERDPRIIYDRMVSYFVGHNMLLPISSPDFLLEMPRRFVERNGLYYLPEQAQQYDKLVARQLIETANMETSLFVCDENSAIAWIRAQLKEKPMTLGEMTPLFMQELSSWTKGERKPELRELLEQNFLCYNGIDDVPSQVHSYLSTNFKDLRSLSKDNPALREKGKGRWYIPDPNKAGDLEKIREKALLKEFSIYESSKGKIKEFRIEAIRAGFKKAWQDKNYALIKNICERMPSAVVEEDEKLLMWYSNSLSRLGE